VYNKQVGGVKIYPNANWTYLTSVYKFARNGSD